MRRRARRRDAGRAACDRCRGRGPTDPGSHHEGCRRGSPQVGTACPEPRPCSSHRSAAALQAWRCSSSPTSAVRNSRSEEHTSELQSRGHLVCRLLLEKKKKNRKSNKLYDNEKYQTEKE